nr:immunoglobulin heavy chain junction region [Homo sapiens]
LCEGPIHHLQR